MGEATQTMCHQSESSIIDHPKDSETYASEIVFFF